jgi:hypothetical protein
MTDILVVLQNAYRHDAEDSEAEQRWLDGIWLLGGTGWKSHTGKRLKEMLPDDACVVLTNSSRNVGNKSSAIFPADLEYLAEKIARIKPSIILACGKVAQEAMERLGVEHIRAPHPAWRLLSKEHTARVRREIAWTIEGCDG